MNSQRARSSGEAFGLVDSSELERIRERQIKINEVLPSMTDRLNEYETLLDTLLTMNLTDDQRSILRKSIGRE